MALKSRVVLAALVKFLSNEISDRQIEYLIPLESKGALLLDLALESLDLPEGHPRPEVLYSRSIEYLPPETRRAAVFGIFDDFVFSGRTISCAIDSMLRLGIPREHIYPMAFFKFAQPGNEKDAHAEVLATTVVPGDGALLRLSQEEVLRDVQMLAVEHKIPASYDNLEWDVPVSETDYANLMRELADTSWFLYYGRREKVDASALLIPPEEGRSFSALPKIRFWYDSDKRFLRVTPISFAVANKGRLVRRCSELKEILTPDNATERQRRFASYQAEAIAEQVALLGYLKPYFRRYNLFPDLNKKHIRRYFGPRASQVVRYLENGYRSAPELPIPAEPIPVRRRLDFYWVAVEIMRILGKEYWTQPPPRKVSRGFSVSQLIDRFAADSSVEAVHAAIDYCADMNLIATFFGWERRKPFRAFRLTENGEMEVGRNDGISRIKLPFFEKFAAFILAKSKNQEAYWWVLEKVPAILDRRLRLPLPQMEATVGFFGDMENLRPTEESKHSLTWPQYKTKMWERHEDPGTKRGQNVTIFSLSAESYAEYKAEILNDPEIIRVIGPTETVLELIKSKTMGHHVAILLDIVCDGRGGTTYLANAIRQAVELIEYRHHLAKVEERQEVSRQIAEWLRGLEEKTQLLMGKRRKRLLDYMDRTVKRLTREERGDIAFRLTQDILLPEPNSIVPAFRDLWATVHQLRVAMSDEDYRKLTEISRQIVMRRNEPCDAENLQTILADSRQAIERWAVALSGEMQGEKVYINARLNVADGETYRMYIVAYDLIGSSDPKYAGREGSGRGRLIQSVISNWFIAFGGYAQRPEFGGGDLGFGFFHSPLVAVQAALWAGYHLELLKRTDALLNQDKPHAGFGILRSP